MMDNGIKRLVTPAMLHNAKNNIKGDIRLMIVSLVLNMLGMPVIMLGIMTDVGREFSNVRDYSYTDFWEFMSGLSMLFMLAAFFCGIGFAMNSFRYLYKKQYVDTMLSFPLGRKGRFLSDYFSGLAVYIAQFLPAFIITLIMDIAGHFIYDGRIFADGNCYVFDMQYSVGDVCTVFSSLLPRILMFGFGLIIVMAMAYTTAVFVISCTGKSNDNVFTVILFNGLLVGMLIKFPMIACDVLDDICSNGILEDRVINFTIPYFSPAGALFYLFYTVLEHAEKRVGSFLLWLPITAAVTAGYAFLTYLVYRRRKAEQTGKPVVFDLFFYALMAMAVSLALFVDLDEFSAIPLIFVAVACFVASVGRSRGFSTLGRDSVAFLVSVVFTAVMYMLSCGVLEAADAYVPPASAIDRIYMDYGGMNDSDHYYVNTDLFDVDDCTYLPYVSDRESIDIVRKLHRNSAAKGEFRRAYDDDSPYRTLTIVYKLKTGGKVIREYTVYGDELEMLYSIDYALKRDTSPRA